VEVGGQLAITLTCGSSHSVGRSDTWVTLSL
jgi:hypothetical protein